jgi:hypothetical protein
MCSSLSLSSIYFWTFWSQSGIPKMNVRYTRLFRSLEDSMCCSKNNGITIPYFLLPSLMPMHRHILMAHISKTFFTRTTYTHHVQESHFRYPLAHPFGLCCLAYCWLLRRHLDPLAGASLTKMNRIESNRLIDDLSPVAGVGVSFVR